MNRVVVFAALVAACGAFAQAPNPTVAPFPLQVIRPANLSEHQLSELQATMKVLMRRAGANVPDSAKLQLALKELKRADCDRDNECLSQLARLSGSLYGLFAAVDSTTEGDVVAWGRVVRDDGKAMSELTKDRQVKLKRGAQPFADVVEQVLMKLMFELKVSELPATKPVAPPEVKPPPPLPPVVVEQEKGTPPQRVAGLASLVIGGLGVVTGVALLGAGAGVGSGSVDAATGYVVQERIGDYQTARTLQAVGGVALGVGAALAVVGGVLALSARGDDQPKVTVMAGPGAAMVGIRGVLP